MPTPPAGSALTLAGDVPSDHRHARPPNRARCWQRERGRGIRRAFAVPLGFQRRVSPRVLGTSAELHMLRGRMSEDAATATAAAPRRLLLLSLLWVARPSWSHPDAATSFDMAAWAADGRRVVAACAVCGGTSLLGTASSTTYLGCTRPDLSGGIGSRARPSGCYFEVPELPDTVRFGSVAGKEALGNEIVVYRGRLARIWTSTSPRDMARRDGSGCGLGTSDLRIMTLSAQARARTRRFVGGTRLRTERRHREQYPRVLRCGDGSDVGAQRLSTPTSCVTEADIHGAVHGSARP